eukprot:TRINITY_DN9505_c0_g1_i8.p1 TRINITY_DN9505_c0_g1~~TRINITY_DN9505_c0_g1_i8.p1  ORF type:complete len:277 (-),score=40.41 TRINITY_DN9505_c0_g1_i8:66-896(-)
MVSKRVHTMKQNEHDLVPELRRRPFICGYYRLEEPRLCHVWQCHNELGNIWTHAFAAVATFARLASWLSARQEDLAWPRGGYFCGVVAFFMVSAGTFIISTQYHWRACTCCDKEFLKWMCLDQSACLAVVVVGFFAGVPMGFHCFPTLQTLYMTQSLVVCGGMSVAVACIPKEKWEQIVAVIVVGTLSALVPMVHWLIISEAGRQVAGVMLSYCMVLLFAAIFVYSRFIPECFAPGRFDLVLNSHQIWHVLVYAVVSLYGECLIRVYGLAEENYCS